MMRKDDQSGFIVHFKCFAGHESPVLSLNNSETQLTHSKLDFNFCLRFISRTNAIHVRAVRGKI